MATAVSPSQLALMEALAARVIESNKGLHMLPFYLSGLFDSLFMGVVISQIFTYWRFVGVDKKHIVALVFLSIAATIAATICIMLWMQHLFVWNFGTYLTFSELTWLIRYMILVIIAAFFVQVVYIDRACRLYRHWWPAALITPFTIASAGVGSTALRTLDTEYAFMTPEALKVPKMAALAYSWLSLIFVTDLLITTVIAYGLIRLKTGWKNTDSSLKRLTTKCFECQTPALVVALICIVFWNQQTQIGILFILLQSKIYVSGLLVTLNHRSSTSATASQAVQVSYPSEFSGIKHSQLTTETSEDAYHLSILSNNTPRRRPHDIQIGREVEMVTFCHGGANPDVESGHANDFGSTAHLQRSNRA